MHEMSLCGSIFGVVDRTAAGRRVSVVHLQVGQLRQVVPDTLRYCWSMFSADTVLAGSELEIDSVPVSVRCLDCELDTTLTDQLLLLCSHCGNSNVAVRAGEEFMLTALDLAED